MFYFTFLDKYFIFNEIIFISIDKNQILMKLIVYKTR